MQKAKRLMDENSVSFQIFLILLSSVLLHLLQKAKFLYSSNVKAILRCLFFGGGSMRTGRAGQ